MRVEWNALHDRFVALGWAESYSGMAGTVAIQTYNAEQTANAGAMSRYGGTKYSDDIAEMVSWAALGGLFEAEGIPPGRRLREDFACQAMATYSDPNVPSRYAAVFSKLHFLQDLGMVDPSAVDRCVGTLELLPISEGMRLYSSDSEGRAFTRDVMAQIGTLAGRYVFEMTASGTANFGGTDYPADTRLLIDLAPESEELELVSWPRGVYRIAPGSRHAFSLRLEDAGAGNFDVTDGYIYVAESSGNLIDGALFVTEAFRNQAPVPVPQVFDPPLNIRFRIEN